MTSHATENIRNIALVGHPGAGKTTLTECLLEHAGVINSTGTVEKGTTVCDFEEVEQEHHHSVSSAVTSFDYQGKHINLVDTPGYPDFLGEAVSALPAVETVAVVINAQTGVDMTTRRLLEWVAGHHFCRMIIVNKIDADAQHLPDLMEQIRESFGAECLPVNLPKKNADGVVDCFFHTSGETAFASVSEIHTALVDQVVEMDETLTERYLEEGDIAPDELHDSFEKALRQDHLVPVCFTSARTGAGVRELLDVILRLMPNPSEGNPRPFLVRENGEPHEIHPEPDPKRHVLAHVFKVAHDPFVGKIAAFRIHQGVVTKDTQLFINEQRKPFKVGHLFKLQGKRHIEIEQGVPGDICAVAKVDEVEFDAVLHDSHDEDHILFRSDGLPTPMVGLAIEPKSRGDEQKLSETLERISAEDPCLVVDHNVSTNETVLRGLGEYHLRIALEKLRTRYHVDVEAHPPAIAYRETITRKAEGHHRHKKQTGGAGQFGEVFLRIAPLSRGSGFEFANKVVGGAIPTQFISAVEKGVRQAMAEGALAGYPVEDVKVTVYDGKHHPVDSNEVSFITAARKAFLDAFNKATPILLEPIMTVQVTVPGDQMGDVTGDLASRRGRISDTRAQGDGRMSVEAQVPLGELKDYHSRLKSLTGGEGAFTMAFQGYEPIAANLQQQLVKEYAARASN